MGNDVVLLKNSFENARAALKPLLEAIEQDIPINESNADSSYDKLIFYFVRVVEIVVNVFFRIIEIKEYNNLTTEVKECLKHMLELDLISDVELWIQMVDLKEILLTDCSSQEKINICYKIKTLYKQEFINLNTGKNIIQKYPFLKESIK